MLKKNNYNKIFLYWLLSLITLIILMIMVGGLTRLTDSGLSITKWELFRGIIPPLNEKDWISYFSEYKKIPQFNILNPLITLSEFKIIYLWEYYHRLLGRIIGILFLIPMIFFILKDILIDECKNKLLLIFFLILTQGFLGWYMVQSGLTENISVSHYRLSIHLIMAFIILSSLFWLVLNFSRNTAVTFFNFTSNYFSIKLLIFLLFFQIIIGAFVSGLDAGKLYQTWPLMNNSYFPDDVNLNKDFFSFFSDHSFVQFLHRNLAYIIFFNVIYIGINILKKKNYTNFKSYLILFFFIVIQIILGIYVLLSELNIYVASMHQISSIFLILFSLNLYHRVQMR